MKESPGELREYSAFTNSTGSLALIDEEGEDRKLTLGSDSPSLPAHHLYLAWECSCDQRRARKGARKAGWGTGS